MAILVSIVTCGDVGANLEEATQKLEGKHLALNECSEKNS